MKIWNLQTVLNIIVNLLLTHFRREMSLGVLRITFIVITETEISVNLSFEQDRQFT